MLDPRGYTFYRPDGETRKQIETGMGETTYAEQAAAVMELASRVSSAPAIQDAAITLTRIEEVVRECRREKPDADKIAMFLTDLALDG